MTVLTTLSPTDPQSVKYREILLALFTPLGKCRFLDEKHFDAVTAVCGSGPAFVCLVLEAMADGGVMMGLPRSEALELAAQSMFSHFCPCQTFATKYFRVVIAMQGAARMVLQTGMHPAAIKDSVTSKRPSSPLLLRSLPTVTN
jgi:pyrroline-5-carboxylate reductase